MSRFAMVASCLALASPAIGQQPPAGPEDVAIPAGPAVPIARDLVCQSEVCIPGIYIACERLELTDTTGPGRRVVGYLDRGDEFRMVAARVLILSTGVVEVTRDVEEVFGRPVNYRQGEFIFLLEHRGEGWYSAWRNGEVIVIEQFWPDSIFGPPGNFTYGGRLVREGETELWYGVERDELGLAWARVQGKAILSPMQISQARFFEGEEPACPV